MKIFIPGLLFLASLVMSVPVSFAQQDPSYQKLVEEVETLKEQVFGLQNQLQTVENVEKMKLSAERDDAKTRLINTEFNKFEGQLRKSNTDWLWRWTGFFAAIIAIIGVALVFSVKSMIADRVEKSLSGFKAALDELDEIKDQLKMLHVGNAVYVLKRFPFVRPDEEDYYREQTKSIPEETLLQIFGDEMDDIELRFRAAEVLAYRKSPLLVAPLLELMHSMVGDDLVYSYYQINSWGYQFIHLLGQIPTQASYQGLKEFLNRLLTEDVAYKKLLVTHTVFTLAAVSVELNKGDSVSMIRESIPDLEVHSYYEDAIIKIAEYFDKFKDPEGIKNILTNVLTDEMPNVETRCLGFLAGYDLQFVNDWHEQKANANTEAEEKS